MIFHDSNAISTRIANFETRLYEKMKTAVSERWVAIQKSQYQQRTGAYINLKNYEVIRDQITVPIPICYHIVEEVDGRGRVPHDRWTGLQTNYRIHLLARADILMNYPPKGRVRTRAAISHRLPSVN